MTSSCLSGEETRLWPKHRPSSSLKHHSHQDHQSALSILMLSQRHLSQPCLKTSVKLSSIYCLARTLLARSGSIASMITRLASEPSSNQERLTLRYSVSPTSVPSLSLRVETASNAMWTLTGELWELSRKHSATWSPEARNLSQSSIIYSLETLGILRSTGHSRKPFERSPIISKPSVSH